MILPRFIRKLLAVLRGGVSPVLIFLSVTLGMWFGLVPGWSGFHGVIIVVMLVLNVHVGLFILSAGLGRVVCLGAAPVLYHVGVGVHDYFSVLLRLLAAVPVVGMTDFDRYSVAGAFVMGPAVGGVCGLLMARSVIGFRRALLRLEEGSERFRRWYSNRWVRILDRLLVGKRTKDVRALFTGKTRIIRKAGVTLVSLVVIGLVVVTSLVSDSAVKRRATEALSRANGAQVDVNELDLSLWKGVIAASGVQVTDAERPERNEVCIGKVAADASIYNLLLGRVVMEKVEISGVRFDQRRASPGKVIEVADREPVFDPCDLRVSVSDIARLEEYIKDAKALKEWLGKVRKWLPKPKEQGQESAAERTRPGRYLEYLDARSAGRRFPRVLAKEVVLDMVEIPSPVLGSSRIRVENLSDAPSSSALPVVFELKSNETAAAINARVEFGSGAQAPPVSGTFAGLELSKLQSSLGQDAGVVFESGTASGRFEGTVTSELVDLTVEVSVTGLRARGEGQGVLGLGGKTTSEALAGLSEISTTIRIVGPTADPRLAFDVEGLTKQFKEALVRAGKQRLAEEIDKQIEKQLGDKLADKVPSEIKKVLGKPKDLLKGLGGLLGGKDKSNGAE